MSDVLLSCRGLVKNFDHPAGVISVLKGIDFELKKGSRTAILGRSGTGKSTFLQVMGTLDKPTQGSVWFKDQNLSTFHDASLASFRNKNMGFVFQFHYLMQEFTALENVMMPAWISGDSGSKVRSRAAELLSLMHLEHRFEHRPMELSGGEQQRVSLARALMMGPEVILTDEVTGNLDAKTSDEVLHHLKTVSETLGVTVLSVTHQRDMAQRFYTQFFTMQDGILLPGIQA